MPERTINVTIALPLADDLQDTIRKTHPRLKVTALTRAQRRVYRDGRPLWAVYPEPPRAEDAREEEARERPRNARARVAAVRRAAHHGRCCGLPCCGRNATSFRSHVSPTRERLCRRRPSTDS